MEITPAMNASLDQIENVEFSNVDLGNLLDKYLVLLSQLDNEGLYDPDQIREVNEDTKTTDELQRLERAFEKSVTLSRIEEITISPPLQYCGIIDYDLRRRITEIILHAPVAKFVKMRPETLEDLLSDQELKLVGDNITRRVKSILEWLQVGLYRRKYGERVESVLYGEDNVRP
jgi:hypothetical protein